jgi:adenosylcobinamide-GDP ribazoletransferase
MTDAWLRDITGDLKIAVQFSTRLPVGAYPADDIDIARAAWAIPIVGAFIGLIGALAYYVAFALGVPPLPSAALALATTMMLTGCLHEDGLADTADGLGGGATPEQKLEIMRDARIGTYGACALILSTLIRVGAVASLAAPVLVTPALIAAHAAGRATMPIAMRLVAPARTDGLSATAGLVSRRGAFSAGTIGLIAVALAFGVTTGLMTALLLLLAILAMARLCAQQIGGQTGDVLGAMQQVGEIIVLLVAAARH